MSKKTKITFTFPHYLIILIHLPIFHFRWNNFRSLCNSEKKLGLVLEVSYENPPAEEINRWLGEPVKALVVPTDIFLTNKRGYPVLSKSHQSLVKAFFSLDVQVIVSGNSHHVAIKHYQQYLNYLYQVCFNTDTLNIYSRTSFSRNASGPRIQSNFVGFQNGTDFDVFCSAISNFVPKARLNYSTS